MRLERKHAAVLLVVAVWNVVIVVNLAIAAVLATLGTRAWKAARTS